MAQPQEGIPPGFSPALIFDCETAAGRSVTVQTPGSVLPHQPRAQVKSRRNGDPVRTSCVFAELVGEDAVPALIRGRFLRVAMTGRPRSPIPTRVPIPVCRPLKRRPANPILEVGPHSTMILRLISEATTSTVWLAAYRQRLAQTFGTMCRSGLLICAGNS